MSFELINYRYLPKWQVRAGNAQKEKGELVQMYKITYKDSSTQMITAVSYKPNGGLYVFRADQSDVVAEVDIEEVRSIVKMDGQPTGIAIA
jgi:hypothetical protein